MAQNKSTMPSGYDDPKTQFDKRVAVETKKVKELLAQVDKGRAELENDRKAYCVDFKKHLIAYIVDESIHTVTFLTVIKAIIKNLELLDRQYETAINHIATVAMPALGYLPKRFEALKKSIKVVKQAPDQLPKVRDFEYERIENIKLALLHFFNAKMFLHAKALELYSKAYEAMRQVNVKTEFRQVDQGTLRQVITAYPHVQGTPRTISARSGGNQSSRGDQNSQGTSPNPRQPQSRGGSAQQQQPQSRGGSAQTQERGSSAQQQQLLQQQRAAQQQQRQQRLQ